MLLVAGAAGFLGGTVLRAAQRSRREVAGVVHSAKTTARAARLVSADLTSAAEAAHAIAELKPDWVLNCAALANVDECERHPATAHALNVGIARNLAEACRDSGARLAHISTDSVFDGERGAYTERDVPSPLNEYARTKLEGERAVAEVLPAALIVRTNFVGLMNSRASGLAGWIAKSVESGEQIRGFEDVIFSPLLANTLAEVLFDMMDQSLDGLYHVSARDSISKYDFAAALSAELEVRRPSIERARLADAPLHARRPLNTSLNPDKVEAALGRIMPCAADAVSGFAAHWRETAVSTAAL